MKVISGPENYKKQKLIDISLDEEKPLKLQLPDRNLLLRQLKQNQRIHDKKHQIRRLLQNY